MSCQNNGIRIKKVGLLALTISFSALMGACSTTSSTRTSAKNPAPISFKASNPTSAISEYASLGTTAMPYMSQSAPSYSAPRAQPQPQPTVKPVKTFDQTGVDTDLYMHQKVGRPYTIKGKRYLPEHNPSYDETGVASWYGPNFHGKLTANGETYNKDALSAAHKTLPLNSMVFVTNLENGKTVTLRLNDRGPFVDGRIIDLSEGAAKVLGVAGLAKVRVQYAGPADPSSGKASKQAELSMPSMPTYKAPVAPVLPTPAPEVTPKTPSYEPLSVIPYDLSGMQNPSQDSYKTPVTLPTLPPQTVTPAPVYIAPEAPEMTRKAPLVQPSTPQRGRQEFTPPADGGVMTLTITGPVHMASANAQSRGEFIPAVHNGSDAPLKAATGVHYVQAAAFSSVARANSVKSTLSAAGGVTINAIQRGDATLHRVLVGPYDSKAEASNALSLVATLGYSDARIVEMH